ncbi:MAG TPA: trehalose-phosphatase [Gemmatimonadales bacterium]|nr:trehalose-phosphatase [Gemmatimonadales bacterium]
MAPARPPAPQRDWAYFFDLDGTLIEFADTPAAVRVTAELRELLERLHDRLGGAVAVITGRPIAEIDVLFPNTRMPVAGQHGAERRNATGHLARHETGQDLSAVRQRLAEAIIDKPGLLLEDKGLSLALHYRRIPHLATFVHQTMEALLDDVDGGYALQQGKNVLELKPAGRDKGRAVLEFMDEPPFAGRTPAFVGDDATDEYGFATVNDLGGHSIKVGRGETVARWRLDNVKAVEEWLRSISR